MTVSDDTINLDFDWTAPGALGAGYIPRLLEIQKHAPLFWSEHQSAWLVTRHADILAGLKDSQRLSNHRFHLALEYHTQNGVGSTGAALNTVRHWVFNNDGREHMRLRTLLLKPFSKSQADSYRPATRALLQQYLDRFEGRSSFDFFHEFAASFVAESILRILGFSDVLTPKRVIGMANAIIAAIVTAGDAQSVRNADAAVDELTPLIEAEIKKRQQSPRDDLLTNLVTLSEGGDRLSREDIIFVFHTLVLAGIDTVANTLSLIMPVMDADRARREYLRAHRERITAIVEELQRYVGMMNMMHRIVVEDFEWHGEQLRKGQMVFFMLAAGNADPRVFDHADTLDFERGPKQQLTFAPGLHLCLGIHIAKMEIEEALLAIFNRFDRARVVSEPTYQENYMTRCFNALELRFER